MANELDPHHLVALMNGVFPGGGDHSLRRFKPSLHTPQHGIVDDHHANDRTKPVLDALAHISVSRESSQVVAIALQLDSQNRKIRLTLAENREVNSNLVEHLASVWGKLQNLSDEYAKQRTQEQEDLLVKSPPIPPNVANDLKVAIFREIYQYSLEKHTRRITKWWTGFTDFISGLLQCRAVGNLECLEWNLYRAAVTLVLIVRLVGRLGGDTQNTLTSGEWEMLYRQSMQANEHAKIVLDADDGLDCEALAVDILGDHPGDAFQLRRALAKLTSLPSHIESLIGFAHSPRLRRALKYDMSISLVPNRPQNVRLPSSRKEWKSFLETAYGEHLPSQWEHALKLSRRFRPRDNESSVYYECPVHCECALIQYLQVKQHNDWDNVRAFSCIGVSKLSCSACRIWIETFNEQGGQRFYTRGSHGNWYWPWGVPREDSLREAEESLGEKMGRKVYREYLAQMRLPDPRNRTASDSSGASSSGAQHHLADDDAALATAEVDTEVQKFGGDFNELARANLPASFARGSTKGAKRQNEPGPINI